MIKEILKGNNIPKIEEKKSTKNKLINSVLYNFIKYKKINLKKKSKKNIFEKTNSVKIINPNKSNSNERNNKTNTSSYSKLFNKRNNNTNIIKSYIRNNNSYTLKRKNKLSREISTNINILNLEEKKIHTENIINKSNDLIKKYYKKYGNNDGDSERGIVKEYEYENESGCRIKKNIFLKNFKLNLNNKIFKNNLEKEFEIRCLKKKIKNLKNNRMLLIQELNNIKKKNERLSNKIIEDEKRRKNIIYSTINICKNNNKALNSGKEFNLKNIFSDLKNLKINYENDILKNNFISGLEQLLILSKNFNNNKNNDQYNNIYYNITNLINYKNQYINDIKEYNILKIENKKYYNYCLNLCKNLYLNNIDELYNYLKNIKSSNDNEIKKIIKMKHVLFYENKFNRNHKNLTYSVDNLINSRKFHNYNYSDLQKFFIENNKKNITRNNYSAKVRNMTIKSVKSNHFSGCLTDKANYIENENSKIRNSSYQNRKNYYKEKREELINKMNILEKSRKIKRIESNIINIDKIKDNEKENNLLYYSYKQKVRNIPHNNKTFKNIEIKRNNRENIISRNNLTSNNENQYHRKKINRIYNYKLNKLTNSLNNSINLKLIGFNSQLLSKNKNDDNNYTYNIKNKKKSFNIKIPFLKMIKNYKTINYIKK